MAMLDEGSKRRRQMGVVETPSEFLALLSPEEQAAIRKRAFDAFRSERKKEAEKLFYDQALAEERRSLDPVYEERDIIIDLAPFAKYIWLDGKIYHHGLPYRVIRPAFDMLMEIMARGWAHDEQVGHPNRKTYTKPVYIGTGNYVQHDGGGGGSRVTPYNADAVVAAQRSKVVKSA